MQALENKFIELEPLENEIIEFVKTGVEETKQLLASVGDVNGDQAVAKESFVRKDKLKQCYNLAGKVQVEASAVSKAGKEIKKTGGGFHMEVTGPGGNQIAKVTFLSFPFFWRGKWGKKGGIELSCFLLDCRLL
jgi:hypothetical protein